MLVKGQQASKKTEDLTDGPKYFLEDDERPNMDSTNKNFKPATNFVPTKARTPGAVHADASSMKGQQAFQKTKDLSKGPKYYIRKTINFSSNCRLLNKSRRLPRELLESIITNN